jgi:microcystin-dependent protein
MGGSAASRLTGTSGGVNGANLGAAGGAQQHTLITAEMPSHAHTFGFSESSTQTGGGGDRLNNISTTGGQIVTTTTAGSGSAHNNVQPTFILNYIIKA